MKRFILRSILFSIVVLFINGAIVTSTAKAQNIINAIPEDDRPSVAGPWFVGGVLSTGVIVVGVKNSKRSHLD